MYDKTAEAASAIEAVRARLTTTRPLPASECEHLATRLDDALELLGAITLPEWGRRLREYLGTGPDRHIGDGLDAPDWDGPTPLDLLAMSLPPISGGSPFIPSEADWDDYARWIDDDEAGRFTEDDARAAGLAI